MESLNTQPFASQVATSRLSILHSGESRPEGVTEAKRSDEELSQTGGSSPEELAAAHLEPLVRSSSASQEDKDLVRKSPI